MLIITLFNSNGLMFVKLGANEMIIVIVSGIVFLKMISWLFLL